MLNCEYLFLILISLRVFSFFVSRTFLVDSPCVFGISYARNMSIDIIERFVKGHQGDVGTNTFRSTTIVLFIIQWVEKARPTPSPACISIADKPTRERNVDFTLAIRCVSMSTLDLSSDWTHKGNNLCSKNKSNKLTKQTERDRERKGDRLPLRI